MTLEAHPPFLKRALPETLPGIPSRVGDYLVEDWTGQRIALRRPRRPLLGGVLVGSSALLVVGAAFFLAFAAERFELGAMGAVAVSAVALGLGAMLLLRGARELVAFPFVLDAKGLEGRARRPLLAPRCVLPRSGIDSVELQLTFYPGEASRGFVDAALLVHDRGGRTLQGPQTDRTMVAGWQALRDEVFPLARELARRTGAPLRLTGKGNIPKALLDE